MNFIRCSAEPKTQFEHDPWSDCALLVHSTTSKWSMSFAEIRDELHRYQDQEDEKLSTDVEIWEMIVKAMALDLLMIVPEKIESISQLRERFAKNEINKKILDVIEAARVYIDEGSDMAYDLLSERMRGFRP